MVSSSLYRFVLTRFTRRTVPAPARERRRARRRPRRSRSPRRPLRAPRRSSRSSTRRRPGVSRGVGPVGEPRLVRARVGPPLRPRRRARVRAASPRSRRAAAAAGGTHTLSAVRCRERASMRARFSSCVSGSRSSSSPRFLNPYSEANGIAPDPRAAVPGSQSELRRAPGHTLARRLETPSRARSMWNRGACRGKRTPDVRPGRPKSGAGSRRGYRIMSGGPQTLESRINTRDRGVFRVWANSQQSSHKKGVLMRSRSARRFLLVRAVSHVCCS